MCDKADGDTVAFMEANTEESLMVRFPKICRGRRTWHVCRETTRNLGDPVCSWQKPGKPDRAKTRKADGIRGVGSAHCTPRTGKPATWGKGRREYVVRKRNINRTKESEDTMQTSLRRIAKKASEDRKCRFHNLSTLFSQLNLEDSFHYLNKQAASGVDGVTFREYARNLGENVKGLVDRLKGKRYHARLVKRVNIPKGGGKMRPLGLPVLEDKLLQTAAARILGAIYEQDFLPCSFGYRPNMGPRDAAKELSRRLQFGKFNYIVEADIKGFFGCIDHDWLIKMLEKRIADEPFIRLIRKWLKAGVLDTTGMVIHPATGTPQGGVVSPILANVYLHYVLDLWSEKVVKRHCVGEVYMCRFADDFVCAFQYKEDAERFFRVLPKRLAKFGLEVAPDKTRILRFSRFEKNLSESFDFLGFEFRWGMSRKGKDVIRKRTSRKKFRNSLKSFKEWTRKNRSLRLKQLLARINVKLRGYYNYYGVIGNYASLAELYYHVVRILFKWLNRRSQKRSFNWKTFNEVLKRHPLLRPRITEKTDVQLSFNFA
jgi:RNA-directed DNA polymerase